MVDNNPSYGLSKNITDTCTVVYEAPAEDLVYEELDDEYMKTVDHDSNAQNDIDKDDDDDYI